MKKRIPQAVAMILLATVLQAQGDQSVQKRIGTAVRAQSEVSQELRDFLAHVNDPAAHERWWADDLVYTSANGVVRTKQEIVKSVREGASGKEAREPQPTFSAEDVKVSQYGDVAVLTFRLVSHEGDQATYYRNTGVLEKHDGRWQVIAWQATKASDYKPEGAKKPTGKE
jgi:ketosteroid isomerase-like protein